MLFTVFPFLQQTRRNVGLSPGSLVFRGEQKEEAATVSLLEYDTERCEVRDNVAVADLVAYRDDPRTTWINVNGLHDVDLIQQVGEVFGIHALVLEDVLNTQQRPKLEEFPDRLYIVLKMLRMVDGRLDIEQVSLIVGPTWVLTFQERAGDVFEPVRDRIRQARGRLRNRGADYLAYALLDVLVDHYFVVLEELGENLERLETRVMDNPRPPVQHAIRALHRELVVVRKAVWPVRELVSQFERAECAFLTDDLHPFLRDLYDHSVQVIDLVESLREMLSGLRDTYQSALGNRMNEIMKFLTLVGTIFIPLTFIAGIYGMNFDWMPELHARYGYPLSLIAMALIALGMVGYFRWKRWL